MLSSLMIAPRLFCRSRVLLGLKRTCSTATNTWNVDALGREYPRDDGLKEAFADLTNLADMRLGAKVLFATDEWFATADNLLKPEDPYFVMQSRPPLSKHGP